MLPSTPEDLAVKAAEEVAQQIMDTGRENTIDKERLLVIADNKTALSELKEQMKLLKKDKRDYLKEEITRNKNESSTEEVEKLGRIENELAEPTDEREGEKNEQEKDADTEDEGLPFAERDMGGKLEFVMNKAMKMFEKFSDMLTAMGSKTLNQVAKFMGMLKMDPALIEFVRGLAGGDRAQVQSVLREKNITLAKSENAGKEDAALQSIKIEYDKNATDKYNAYVTDFRAKNPAPVAAPAAAPATAPVAGAAAPATTPAATPAATPAPEPMSIDLYKESNYTLETHLREWLPKLLTDKKGAIDKMPKNDKGQRMLTLEQIAALKEGKALD